mgnify:CR=1 FL=1
MAFASNSGGGAMADINVTPLVDVMLVLLIIFMVTMPIQSIPVDVDLPQKTDKPPENPKEPPDPIELRIDGSGQIFALAVMAVAASEVVVGLGMIVAMARRRLDLDIDTLTQLRG